METQNAEVRNLLRETSEEKTISPGITPFEELNYELEGWTAADIRLESDDAPPPGIAAKSAPSHGHDPGVKTREWRTTERAFVGLVTCKTETGIGYYTAPKSSEAPKFTL